MSYLYNSLTHNQETHNLCFTKKNLTFILSVYNIGNVDLLSPNYLSVSNPLNNLILQSQCQSPVMINHSEMSWNHLGVPFTHQLMPTHQQLLLQHLMPRGARQAERNTLGHSLSLPDIAGTLLFVCMLNLSEWLVNVLIIVAIIISYIKTKIR